MGLVGRSTETLAYIIQNTAANYAKCFWKWRKGHDKDSNGNMHIWYLVHGIHSLNPNQTKEPEPGPQHLLAWTWTKKWTELVTLNTNWLFSPKWLDFAEMCCTKGIQSNWIWCTWNTFPLYVTAFSSTLKPQRCPCRSSTPFETSFFFLTTSLK